MKTPVDVIIAAIAQQHLGLESLEARNSDRLDFSEQAVWSLKNALEAAFAAGRDFETKRSGTRAQRRKAITGAE
jgi:hypothetical protein